MKNLLSIIFLLVFACSGSKPVDSSNFYSRGGLVYHNKHQTLIGWKGIFINRWHEDGKILKELYDWEEEAIKDDIYYSDSRRPLNYIIKTQKWI